MPTAFPTGTTFLTSAGPITGTSAARAGPAPRQPSSSPAAASARKHKSRSPCALPFLFRSN